MAPNRRHAIFWPYDDLVYWRIYASHGFVELTVIFCTKNIRCRKYWKWLSFSPCIIYPVTKSLTRMWLWWSMGWCHAILFDVLHVEKNFFLTQFGLVTPFAIMDFCQQVQIMFVVRRPQANIQTNVDVSAIGHISVTFYLILKTSDSRTSKMSDMVLTSICFESTIVLEVQKYFFLNTAVKIWKQTDCYRVAIC